MAKQAAEVETKKERGDGPAVFTYTDAAGNKELKRVPSNPGSVDVLSKAGVSKSYKPSELPEAVKNALIEFAFATRAKSYVNNHGKKDGSDAIELTDKIWNDLVEGKIYTRSENGAKVGRKFDATIYVQAWTNVYKHLAKKGGKNEKGQPITELTQDLIDDLRTGLEAMDAKTRVARIKGWKENPYFVKALKELQAKAVDLSDAELVAMPF